MRGLPLTFLAALCACGLVDPPAPPARIVGEVPLVPGAAVPDRGADGAAPPFHGYELVWHDELDGWSLDGRSWSVDEGPWRDAVNSRDSVVVRDGVLSLVTFTTPDGVHHAPRVHTNGKVALRYGYFEARVRFLDSAGEWCSFFLYPDTIGNPMGDPGAAGVEIDVFEHRDQNPEGFDLRQLVQVGVNWDGFGSDWKRDNRMLAHPLGEPLSHAWHTYAVLWEETGHTFYIDDLPVWRSTRAVSHIPEPLYFACEVRSGSWAGYVPAGGYGPRDSSTTRMEVDWVRVWQAAR